ncbi:MAG: B12-binding domain-containing radical SAM protein [Nitrospinae bacterium]|nr:B12-binding domain-containing radical SAM protein [Nitrospinota bacterium]
MKILLIAMPDAANNFFRMVKIPNLGLCSIAANLKGHEVKILDLVLAHKGVGACLSDCLREFTPDLAGVSSMSFQYPTAKKAMSLIRQFDPGIKIALGGYHATTQWKTLAEERDPAFDFIIRGEGERAFPMLADALERGASFSGIPGLSYKENGKFAHNPPGELMDLSTLPLPDRSPRLLKNFTYLSKKMDAIETSRGCSFQCSFCSIANMYGRSFRPYSIDRVIRDLERVKSGKVETVLMVDDNITQDVPRFKAICEAIVEKGLNSMEYFVQASVLGIAQDPELVDKMAAANFKLVFLGIESVHKKNLQFLKKGDIREKTVQAVDLLKSRGIAILGGFIVGNPDDTREDVRNVFKEAKKLRIDLAVVQCLTPYPSTKLREELLEMGLVTNKNGLSRYNGFMCNVRTRHMTNKQLNRAMNWENMKMFFRPGWFVDNNLIRNREKGSLKVMLNNFEYIRGWFQGDQFRSRHRF